MDRLFCLSAVTATSSLPAPGQGFGLEQLVVISAAEVPCELGCEAGKLGSPSSGGSGEMVRALLSSFMAFMEGGGGAKE